MLNKDSTYIIQSWNERFFFKYNDIIIRKFYMRKSKENQIYYTQNQSMLVSERKQTYDQFHNLHKKVSKKQSNHACECSTKLNLIETKIEMLSLNLDEMASHINISFTKHMESYSKIAQEQKKRDQLQHLIWQLKEQNQAYFQKYTNQSVKSNQQVTKLSQEVMSWAKMLREVKNWKNSQSNWAHQIEKQFIEGVDKHKKETDEKLKKMLQAIQEIGILQRKMLIKNQKIDNIRNCRAVSTKQRHSLGGKKYSVWNESTLLASSHNY